MKNEDLDRNRPGRRLVKNDPWSQRKSHSYKLATECGKFVSIEASSISHAKLIASEMLRVPYHKIYLIEVI